MSDEKQSGSNRSGARRKVLKNLIATGGIVTVGNALPERWKKPVLEYVTLPAHAQTSPKGT